VNELLTAIDRSRTACGWDDISLLHLCLAYIANQEDNAAFLDFLASEQAQFLEEVAYG
jgi:hypothetical protein